MNVETAYDGPSAIVHVEGRLDAEWATHLAGTLDDLLRSGVRSAVVDLAAVSYVSSAGARVLTTSAQAFAALRGELLVATPPPLVVDALGNAGLEDRVVHPVHAGAGGRLFVPDVFDPRSRATRDWRAPATLVSRGSFETSTPEPGATLTCRVIGDPARVLRGEVEAADCRAVSFAERMFGLGTGALGEAFEDCGPRLGELLAVAGAAAFLPTDGGRVPDYQTTLRGHAPRALLACGLTCEGAFSHLIRFTATRGESVPISELARVCLDVASTDVAGVAMIVETAGLVGATRRRSPVATSGGADFALPALREWLSFTAEPAHAGTTALITGVIARNPAPPLRAHVRPLDDTLAPHAHLHAAVFSYHPVPQRTVAVEPVVASLFDEQTLRAVMHLLTDRREGAGVGESRFVRGLVWAAPIATVIALGA